MFLFHGERKEERGGGGGGGEEKALFHFSNFEISSLTMIFFNNHADADADAERSSLPNTINNARKSRFIPPFPILPLPPHQLPRQHIHHLGRGRQASELLLPTTTTTTIIVVHYVA